MAAIIFDFDGTIADSFDYVATFLEGHIRKSHVVRDDEKAALRGMTMPQMAAYFGSPKWKLPILFAIGRRAMGRAIYNVPIFQGMAKVIEQLHAEGHELMIVSSNNNRNIKKSLKQHHLHKFFTDVYGNAGFFGKRRALRRILARNHISEHNAVYVGDEARDIMAAQAAGVRIISASWGFDHPDVLASHHPTAIAQMPTDIIGLLAEM